LESREHDSIRLKITEQAKAAHLERVLAGIRSAAQVPGNPVADALAAAIGRRQGRERLAARKCKRDEEEAERRQEEEAVISALWVELQARPRWMIWPSEDPN
jgi:hypothetical protein